MSIFFARTHHPHKFIPKPEVMHFESFRKSKRLAQKFDIKDNFGKAWNFQSHQFRHTVGTRMINNGYQCI